MAKISNAQVRTWNAQRTMAPSQKVKMERIEGINVQVLPFTARQHIVKCGLSVEIGEKCWLVQSDRFRGWYYVVIWNETSVSYQCSCGNPHCTVHTKPVSEYVHAHAAPKVAPYVRENIDEEAKLQEWLDEADRPEEKQEPREDVVAIAAVVNEQIGSDLVHVGFEELTREELVARIKSGTAKQKELSRQHAIEYRARLESIKRAQALEVA